MEPHKIDQLFRRYLQNQYSPDEIELLFQYFDADENESVLKDLIQKELESSQDTNFYASPKAKARLDKLFKNIKKNIRKAK